VLTYPGIDVQLHPSRVVGNGMAVMQLGLFPAIDVSSCGRVVVVVVGPVTDKKYPCMLSTMYPASYQ
jgi:hypothetical protein